jgi:hypothetical protein
MNELDDAIRDRIKTLCAAGDAAESFGDAIAYYEQAWDLLPDPKTRWSVSRLGFWQLSATTTTHRVSSNKGARLF